MNVFTQDNNDATEPMNQTRLCGFTLCSFVRCKKTAYFHSTWHGTLDRAEATMFVVEGIVTLIYQKHFHFILL